MRFRAPGIGGRRGRGTLGRPGRVWPARGAGSLLDPLGCAGAGRCECSGLAESWGANRCCPLRPGSKSSGVAYVLSIPACSEGPPSQHRSGENCATVLSSRHYDLQGRAVRTENERPMSSGRWKGWSRMHEKSIKVLNDAVGDELSAVHQYMYWHFHCDDQGFDLLAGLFKRTAIEEMLHVERLAERILFLKGDVEMKVADPVKTETDVQKMLEMAVAMEEQSAKDYNRMAMECAQNADSQSKQLFEALVADEERHYDQYDTELDNLGRFGKDYLALQSIERARTRGAQTPAG